MFGDAEADSFDFDILDSTKLIPRRSSFPCNAHREDGFRIAILRQLFCGNGTSRVLHDASRARHWIYERSACCRGEIFHISIRRLSRLGGPNFHEIPINRPVCPFSNGQRDGLHRMTIDTGDTSYGPNSLDENFPAELPVESGGFATFPARVDGIMRRVRSASFEDHFTQATMFYASMSEPEKQHIISAFSFELAKLNRVEIRERVIVKMLANIDRGLASAVAENVGLSALLDGAKTNLPPNGKKGTGPVSPLLSQLNPAIGITGNLTGRKIAILVADGTDVADVEEMQAALEAAGASSLVLSSKLGSVAGGDGAKLAIDHTLLTMPSVGFDAVYVPGGDSAASTLAGSAVARDFVAEAFAHCKAVAASGAGQNLLAIAGIPVDASPEGLVLASTAADTVDGFIEAIGNHRAWDRGDVVATAVK